MKSSKIDHKDSPKFQQIVESATNLFMRYGVKRVTVEEICKTAQVSKMTFYKYFNHKIDLAEYIIFSILEEGQGKFDLIIASNLSFKEKVNQFIKLKMDYAKQISKEFLMDFTQLSNNIYETISEFGEKNQKILLQLITEAQKTGEARDDIDIRFITIMLNKFIELRDDPGFVDEFNNVEEITADMINFFFYGIMGKK